MFSLLEWSSTYGFEGVMKDVAVRCRKEEDGKYIIYYCCKVDDSKNGMTKMRVAV